MERKQYQGQNQEKLKWLGFQNPEKLKMELIEYEAGEFLCHQGQILRHLLIVLSGEAKVFCNLENGKRLLISFYEPGGLIGDLEFFLNTTVADSSVQAMTKVLVLAVPFAENREKLLDDKKFLFQLGNHLAHKIQRSTKNNAHNLLYPLETRLCSYIDTACEQDVFDEKLTEVAEALGTSYRHLLRALNTLIEKKILRKENHKYVIIDRKSLREESKDFYKPIEGYLER